MYETRPRAGASVADNEKQQRPRPRARLDRPRRHDPRFDRKERPATANTHTDQQVLAVQMADTIIFASDGGDGRRTTMPSAADRTPVRANLGFPPSGPRTCRARPCALYRPSGRAHGLAAGGACRTSASRRSISRLAARRGSAASATSRRRQVSRARVSSPFPDSVQLSVHAR